VLHFLFNPQSFKALKKEGVSYYPSGSKKTGFQGRFQEDQGKTVKDFFF
jgi:hypothetical protein